MARISGVNLPNNKRVEIALTYIYGIGLTRSQKLLAEVGIDPNVRAKDLTESEVETIRAAIEKNDFNIEGDLRRQVRANVKRLKEINSYRGLRHARHLPVRGQSTKTNNRTVRGNKRATAASGRKPGAQTT